MSTENLEDAPETNTTSSNPVPPLPGAALSGEEVILEDNEFFEDSSFTSGATEFPVPPVEPAQPAQPVELAEPADSLAAEPAAPEEPLAEALVQTASAIPSAVTAVPVDEESAVQLQDVLSHRSSNAELGPVGTTMPAAAPEPTYETRTLRRSLIAPQAGPVTAVIAEPVLAPKEIADDVSMSVSADDLLAGATILPTVNSRAGQRWLSAICTILLTPVMWYLLTDAAARLSLADGNPWKTGVINPAALAELLGGLIVLCLIGILANLSSLGLFLSGIVLTIVGIPFIAAPGATSQFIADSLATPLESFGGFGQNLLFHLTYTGAAGILFMAGICMILSSWVANRLRRKGRSEEAMRAEVAAVNPEGIRARWARKATTNSHN